MVVNTVRTGPRDGETVVLVHSAGLDLTWWDAQIDALRGDHDVVALDLPGHGRSGGTAQDMHMPVMIDAVSTVVRGLDATRVHLVGLSVGGVVVQAVAAREPRAIRTLTLIDTGAHFTAPARAAMIDRAADIRRDGLTDGVLDGLLTHWFRPATLDVRPHLVDRARKTLSLLDDTVHAALWEMIAAVDERERLVDIVAPTTVVVGEHDTSSPVATAAELVSGIAGSTLHVVPGAAHLSPVECPAAVTTIIRSAVAAGAAHR